MEFPLNLSHQTRYLKASWQLMPFNKEFLVVIHLTRLSHRKYNSYSLLRWNCASHFRLPLYRNVGFKCYLRTGLTPCGLLSTHTIFLLCNFFLRKMKVRLLFYRVSQCKKYQLLLKLVPQFLSWTLKTN